MKWRKIILAALSVASLVMVVVLGSMLLGLTGCRKEGPAERAGKEIDRSVEKAGKELEKAGKQIQETFGGRN